MLRLYTDGSYSDLTGVGSWAWLLVSSTGHEVGSGMVDSDTSPQRMELTAALEGLAAVPEGSRVEVVSDSSCLVEAMRFGYPERWRAHGWNATGHKRSIADRDLWQALVELVARRRVHFTWVKAHNGDAADPLNVMVDRMAKAARRLGESAA